MLRSYFIVGLRGFLRNKLTSFINVFGLMLGLTTGIIIMLMMVFAFGANKFHKNYEEIHIIEMNQVFAGTIYTNAATSPLLGPALQKALPQLKDVVRTVDGGQSVTAYGDKSLYQKSMFAEPNMFQMMTFPALAGDPVKALRQAGGVVLTETAARRLFGSGTAMGKTIVLDNNWPLKVGAVVKDQPLNSTIQFDLVVPYTFYEKLNPWAANWNYRLAQTWLQLRPGTNVESLNRQMTALLLKNSSLKQVSLFAYPIARLELYDNFKDGKPFWGKAYLFISIGILAFLTLLIACINFMNLSTAIAERRAREVGVRKVLGASRRIIIGQFLGEAVLLAMAALVVSVWLAYISLPWLAAFSKLPLRDEFGKPLVWVLLVAIGVLTGLMAGSYPALYLSRFQPAKVLKKLMSTGRRGAFLRKSLVTVQFVISIFLVVVTIVTWKQLHYLENRPLGYDAANLVDIAVDGKLPEQYDVFKAGVRNMPGIVGVTGSTSNLLDAGNNQLLLDWPGRQTGQELIIPNMTVQYDWTKTTGLTMVEGRDFSADYGTDTSACLLNQAAVRKMNLKEPVIGVTVGGKKVIGVLQDFVFNTSGGPVPPLIVYLRIQQPYHFLIRLADDGQWKAHLAQMEKTARTLNPGFPFVWQFLDEEHQRGYKNDFGVNQLATVFAVLAILISCLGLFGLASFAVERRAKENSIRRVLGARPGDLWWTLAADMLKPVSIGIIIATALAVITCSASLRISEYHIALSWWIFAGAGVGAVLVALATVSYHGARAARVNPARVLATE